MAFKDLFRRIVQPAPTPPAPPDNRKKERELAAEWLEAMEAGKLHPPADVHDADAWDTYWTNHLKVGPMEQGFADMMSSDDGLVGLLITRGAHSILCAGNGLSLEALSLALHGFQVTALDISRVAGATLQESLRDHEHPMLQLPGFRVTNNGLVFEDAGPIPVELAPQIHRTDAHPLKSGGLLTFVSGDLTAPEVCPGPFDVVIERRTVQLFPEEEQEPALDRLAARLAERGTLVSHIHDGCGGPDDHRPHHAHEWAKARGFAIGDEADPETVRSAPRLAWLDLSTG